MATIKAEAWLDWQSGGRGLHVLLHSLATFVQENPPPQHFVHLDLHVIAMLPIEGHLMYDCLHC